MVLNAEEGVISYVLTQTGDPQNQVTTIGMMNLNEPTVADMNALMSHFSSTFASDMGSTYTLIRVEERYSMDGANESVVQSDVSAINCSGGASILPSNCAVIMKKRSGFSGRAKRGRMYWPGIKEADVDDLGNLSAGGSSAWNGNAGSLYTVLDTITRTPAILHVNHAPATAITSIVAAAQIGTQRRRMRR